MIRTKLIVAWLAFAAAGLYLPGAATPLAAPQWPQAPPPKLSRRPGAIKPTWHSGPATTPPQTEVVLPPRDVPPPAKSQILGGQAEGKKAATEKPAGATSADPGWRRFSPSDRVPASAPNAVLRDDSDAAIPETQRIRVELERLRDDAGARRAFYDELRLTLEQVRTGQEDRDSQNPASPRPGIPQPPANSPKPPATDKPEESSPARPRLVQASLNWYVNSVESYAGYFARYQT